MAAHGGAHICVRVDGGRCSPEGVRQTRPSLLPFAAGVLWHRKCMQKLGPPLCVVLAACVQGCIEKTRAPNVACWACWGSRHFAKRSPVHIPLVVGH